MFKISLTAIVFGLFLNQTYSQILLHYSFDQCQKKEMNNQTAGVSSQNMVECSCGLSAEGIRGTNQKLIWPTSIDSFFRNNFSLGFAVQIDNAVGEMDLFSKTMGCNADTSFGISYLAKDSNFVFSLRQGFDKFTVLAVKAEANKCWQQVFFTKNENDLRIYLNGKLVKQLANNYILHFNDHSPLKFNSSPCQLINQSPFSGILDEVYIANYPFITEEVNSKYSREQEILTKDTTIFLGQQFDLRAQSNCNLNFNWSPVNGLADPTKLITAASPMVTTKYTATFELANCQVKDEVLIRVVDKDKVDCNALKLPTAFTPNEDGLNDEFGISNPFIIEKLKYFDILDRNGGIMVSFSDPLQKWDGRFNGKKLNPASYVYRIAYTCRSKEYRNTGTVYLMR